MKKCTFAICFLLALCLLGCERKQDVSAPAPTDAPETTVSPAGTAALENTFVPANTVAPEPTPISVAVPTSETTPVPEPADTPAPTDTPSPTREPRDGDITDHFPTYDTGVDADYSYQSDELRIAIRVVEDEEELQKYYVADVWVRNLSAFRAGFGNGQYGGGTEDGEKFARREHAVLAVNGSMNYGIVFHNGVKYRGVVETAMNPGVAVVYTDGSMKVFHRTRFNVYEALKKGIYHAWQFGPALVSDGVMAKDFPVRATRHPRIILGYYEPGHYCLVAVDGRSKTALGMTEREMAELMLELGCQEAMNLDGGTSAMMVFMGECISHPSGVDKDGDGKAGRKLKDMILFAEYDDLGVAPALEDVDPGKVRRP